MAVKTFALWLLLVGTVVSPGRCQHWSFGLSPGGKRELGCFQNPLDKIVEGFADTDAPRSVLSSEEESALTKIIRLKGLLERVTDRENGHQAFKKEYLICQ